MSKENMQVMQTLIRQCKQAFQAKKPLILIDTEDIDLMDRLARESKLVDFYESAEKAYLIGQTEERKYVKYRKYIDYQDAVLDRTPNFTYQAKELKEIATKGGGPSYGEGSMMAVVHLTQQDRDTIECLRAYVHSYVHCMDNASALRTSCVLLYGDPGILPSDLLRYTEILTVNYPSIAEIKEILIEAVKEKKDCPPLEDSLTDELSNLMVGFSLPRAEEYIHRLLWIDGEDGRPMLFSKKRKNILLDAKAQAIRSSGGLLTLYREKDEDTALENQKQKMDDNDTLCGMGAYKEWAAKAGKHMNANNDYALQRGVPAMKGVLLCGVPGCGKSEAAKILYREWKLPMLRLDVDQLMGGLVGDSERNMRQALALAEAMSPCILWIDEIEKGFSGASSSQGDGGTFKRMFGRLLTWMQENKKPCFIFATANDISHLPPEFFRSGRFDALFSVYMPTNEACKELFKEHMKRASKRRRDTAREQGRADNIPSLFDKECFDDSALQSIMDIVMQVKNSQTGEGAKFLSGADIEKIVSLALKEIAPEDSEKPVNITTPIEITTWKEALKKVISDETLGTQGSSCAALDQIAACYVRLMRENFVPVSEKSQQLFQKQYYQCNNENGRIKVSYTGNCPLKSDYDKALFCALKDRIERIASKVETYALEQVCR